MSDSFPSAAPTSYDIPETRIHVLHASVFSMAKMNMPTAIDHIVDSWVKIGDTWNGLKLGWAGDSADAAKDFNDRLQKVQAELFGVDDPDNPQPGILNLVRGVAMQASVNYDRAETQVLKMFDPFCEKADEGDTGQPPQNSSYDPIQITYGSI